MPVAPPTSVRIMYRKFDAIEERRPIHVKVQTYPIPNMASACSPMRCRLMVAGEGQKGRCQPRRSRMETCEQHIYFLLLPVKSTWTGASGSIREVTVNSSEYCIIIQCSLTDCSGFTKCKLCVTNEFFEFFKIKKTITRGTKLIVDIC